LWDFIDNFVDYEAINILEFDEISANIVADNNLAAPSQSIIIPTESVELVSLF